MIMTRGSNKKAFGVDMQRGEGSAERESMLRGGPISLDETPAIPTAAPVEEPTVSQAPPLSAFRATESQVNPVDELPQVEGYMPNNPVNIDRTNAILASINDILGGSEEASALIRYKE
tara:strand:- start:433 stop:786 length:354 start_codon:yes stop_codon:yes gene_type:complete